MLLRGPDPKSGLPTRGGCRAGKGLWTGAREDNPRMPAKQPPSCLPQGYAGPMAERFDSIVIGVGLRPPRVRVGFDRKA